MSVAQTIPLAALLANAATQMTDLAARAQALDEGIAGWVEQGEAARPDVAMLQDIDFLAQSLGCFAGLLSRLAEDQATQAPVCGEDVVAKVFLRGLRHALLAPANAKDAD